MKEERQAACNNNFYSVYLELFFLDCQVARSWFSARAAVFRTTSSSEVETGAKRSGRSAQTCSKSSFLTQFHEAGPDLFSI